MGVAAFVRSVRLRLKQLDDVDAESECECADVVETDIAFASLDRLARGNRTTSQAPRPASWPA